MLIKSFMFHGEIIVLSPNHANHTKSKGYLQAVSVEWNQSDLPMAFKSFKQYCQLFFERPSSVKQEKVKAIDPYILLWIGEERH